MVTERDRILPYLFKEVFKCELSKHEFLNLFESQRKINDFKKEDASMHWRLLEFQ